MAPVSTLLLKLPLLMHKPMLQSLLRPVASSAMHQIELDVPVNSSATAGAATHMMQPVMSAACHALSMQLAGLPALCSFTADGHDMADSSVGALVSALQLHTQLTRLSLAGNECGDIAAHMLSESLPCWPKLQLEELQLHCSQSISAEGASVLAGGVSLTALTRLCVGPAAVSNACLDAALAQLTSLRHLQASLHDATCAPLQKLNSLTHLDLVGPQLELSDAAAPLARTLSSMPALPWLGLHSEEPASLQALPCASLMQNTCACLATNAAAALVNKTHQVCKVKCQHLCQDTAASAQLRVSAG